MVSVLKVSLSEVWYTCYNSSLSVNSSRICVHVCVLVSVCTYTVSLRQPNLECCFSEVFFVVVCICVLNEAESHWVALAGPEFTNVHLYYHLWTTLFSNSISLGPGACSSGYTGWVVSPRDPFFYISPLLSFQSEF